jgi:hypothetical protein
MFDVFDVKDNTGASLYLGQSCRGALAFEECIGQDSRKDLVLKVSVFRDRQYPEQPCTISYLIRRFGRDRLAKKIRKPQGWWYALVGLSGRNGSSVALSAFKRTTTWDRSEPAQKAARDGDDSRESDKFGAETVRAP